MASRAGVLAIRSIGVPTADGVGKRTGWTEGRWAMNSERYWLCWSFRQARPHIEREAEGLRVNLEAFTQNRAVDYVPIAIFNSREEASAFVAKLSEVMQQRFEAKISAEEAKWN
jgi:hypothetical protein